MASDSGIPGHFPHQLAEWWEHGPGAARIQWGRAGDFGRCVRLAVEEAHMDPERAKGFCNERHHAVLGIYPATHAAEIRKATGRSLVTSARAEMTAASINDLPDSAFAYIEPGGKKDPSGRTVPRSLRHFPVHDADHTRNALSRAPQSPFGDKAMPKIRAAAKKFGIDAGDSNSGSSRSAAPYHRSFAIDDVSVKTVRDGRIVDALAAVWDTPAEVRDEDGHYEEELDRTVFNRAIANAAPQGSRRSWKVGVFYNHGKTIHGTPSDLGSVPIGTPQDIKADSRGLWTTTKYHRSDFIDLLIEGMESGAIPGYSFTGHFMRTSPLIPRGGFRPNSRSGQLPRVRRLESSLVEYGPTPFPIYADAAITAVRADTLLGAMAADPDLAMRMIQMFRDSTQPSEAGPLPLAGTPEWEPPTGDPPLLRHSARPVKQEIQAARSAFLQRQHRR